MPRRGSYENGHHNGDRKGSLKGEQSGPYLNGLATDSGDDGYGAVQDLRRNSSSMRFSQMMPFGREYVRAKLSTGLTWLPGKKNLLPRVGLEKLSPDGKRQTLKLRRDSTEGGDKKDGGGLQLIAPPQEKVVATVEGISEYLAKKRRRDRWKIVIDPRKSQFMSLWDVVMMLSLLYLSLVTPFEVAFLPAKDYYDELFFVNRGVDCIFLVDMVLNFFVMFTLEDINGVRWIDSPRLIVWNYLKGWFFIDVFTMLPSAVDFVRDSGAVNLINVTDASGAIIATRSRPEATGATKTVFQLASQQALRCPV